MKKKLIEKWFPVKEISRDAGIEMSYKSVPAYIKHARELGIEENTGRDFFDPKIRNLHPWFARRPCSASRAINLSAVLEDVSPEVFLDILGWNDKKSVLEKKYPPLLVYTDAKRSKIRELLRKEGKNLDKIVICDPMAGGGAIPFESLRLGIKTIAMDYNPVAYVILKATLEFPAKYGSKLAERVKEESELLISFAEEKLRTFYPEGSEGYIIARGIRCNSCSGVIPLVNSPEITSKQFLLFLFNKTKKDFKVLLSKKKTELPFVKRGKVVCPYCGKEIKKEEAYRIWTKSHTKILENLLNGRVDNEEILKTHIILVRQTKNGYKIANSEDFRAFLESCRALSMLSSELRRFLPKSEIPEENEVFSPTKRYGIKYWYQLFNPRQLLSIAYLSSYVHNRIQEIPKEDLIGKSAMLYLALGINRIVDYNSILTTWKKGTIRDTLGQYARNRKISYSDAYCEAIVPERNIKWVFETKVNEKTQGGIVPILNEICKRLEGLGDKIAVYHGDARKMSLYIKEKVDVINVDPPYFDTHIYSDVSELFWQTLKISVKKLIEEKVIFGESKVENWDKIFESVPREGELIVRKNKKTQQNELWYAEQMFEFFKEAYKLLKDDGLLIVWFTHKSMSAWKTVISALYGSNFFVSRIWPVTTELLTRLVARNNGSTLNKTLIIVARKKGNFSAKMEEYAEKLAVETLEALEKVGSTESEKRVFLNAAVMSSVTVEPLKENPILHCYEHLIPKSAEIAEKILGRLEERKWTTNSGK